MKWKPGDYEATRGGWSDVGQQALFHIKDRVSNTELFVKVERFPNKGCTNNICAQQLDALQRTSAPIGGRAGAFASLTLPARR